MNGSSRALVVIGVLILAVVGCGKGAKTTTGETKEPVAGNAAPQGETKSGGEKAGSKTSVVSKSSTETPPPREARKSGTLTEADNEKEFHFKQGEIITVVLDANHADGFSWSLAQPVGSVIVSEGKPAYAVTGGTKPHGSETWRFRAAKPGYWTVKMNYERGWASIPERTFRFSGTVAAH